MSNQVKVLIDGIDVSDPSNPNRSFDFGQLLTADIYCAGHRAGSTAPMPSAA
jgi:hypothetical protein